MQRTLSSTLVTAPSHAQEERESEFQDAVESISNDPITNLPYQRPVIDPCGHTYDLETVRGFRMISHNTVQCPISRRAVRIDQFVPNRYAENVLWCSEEAHRRSVSSPDLPSRAPEPVVERAPQSSAEAAIEGLASKLQQILIKLDDMETDNRLMHRQVTNLVSMSYGDRLFSLIKCNHLSTVRDRGLTEAEKRRINNRGVLKI